MRAFRACTISSIMSNCKLCMLPNGSVAGGPVDTWLSRREPINLCVCNFDIISIDTDHEHIESFNIYLFPEGNAATDSRRPRPKIGGTLEMVTTECRRPDGCGACDNVAKNSASFGDGPDPSPPRSDNRRTWLAVMPSVTCCDGNECLRVSRGSRHGDNKYGLTGESVSRLSRGVDFLLVVGTSVSSQLFDSSTTILNPSWLNDGVNDDRLRRFKCSENQ